MSRRRDKHFERPGLPDKYSIGRAITLGAKIVVSMTQAGSSTTNCIQTMTMSGTPTGGQHKIRSRGTTSALNYNCTAANVKAALEALSGIGVGNVNCSGGPLNTTPIIVEFVGDLAAQKIGLMKSLFGKLVGGTLTLTKGGFGWVAKLEGDLGSEVPGFDVAEVYNRFRDLPRDLQCLYGDTGDGDEIIQAECDEG